MRSPRSWLLVLAFLLTNLLAPAFLPAEPQSGVSEPKPAPEAALSPEAYGGMVKAVKAKSTIGIRRIEPGTGLEPVFSDPNRVATILKLISDVYYGKPLQYPKDGVVFSNRENLLPPQPKGYYREYTVMPPQGSPSQITVGDEDFTISPSSGTRGAERLIIGGGVEAFYSPNHYKTFILLTILR